MTRHTTAPLFALVIAATLAACGGKTLHTSEARQDLRDCRRVGDMSACIETGRRYSTGDDAELDIDRATALYSRACRDDHRNGCYHLGVLGLNQNTETQEEIVHQLERSCRRYNIDACSALIDLLETEEAAVYDADYAQRIRDRLCYDGFEFYCFRDTDGDGINDRDDACPEEPEDADGFEDGDGCPDTDNDQDGVLDVDDTCPDIAEDLDGFEDGDGCIDFDNDGDGILDDDDGCPDIAEDMDGFEDGDGCIDFDNDGDGILDDNDDCPDIAEDYDGFEDRDGCPEEGAGVVELTCEAIVIGDKVYFDNDSDVIQERSYPLLNQVADVLIAVSYVRLIEVAGHTDDRGADDYNLDLSNRRAASVVRYLVDAGVEEARLRGVGYGETTPIAPNTTAAGRGENRRVEFNIVEQDSVCTE